MIDRDRVMQIISLLKGSSASELAVREGEVYIRVRRAQEPTPPAVVTSASEDTDQPGDVAGGAPSAADLVVRARLVGRFYHGKSAGQPSLVKIGDEVEEGQIIATIEALGKLTGVPAPASGVVTAFLTEDGKAVQYGAHLIRLRQTQE